MLDFRAVLFKKYESRLRKTTPANQRKIAIAYHGLEDPVVYTAFLLQACHSIKHKSIKFFPEMIEDIHESIKAKKIITKEVSGEKMSDAIELYETYDNALAVFMRFKTEHEWAMPYVIFCPGKFFVNFLSFVMDFDKEKYPLVSGWEEFIASLPNFLSRKKQTRVALKFYEYITFVKNGDFDYWYRLSKGYGRKGTEKIDWVEAYRDEIRKYNDEKLKEELGMGGWGKQYLKAEHERRHHEEKKLVEC